LKRTKLLVVFALATVGLFGTLASQAYAYPSYSGACTGCHTAGSATSLAVTLASTSTTSATYNVVTNGTGWATFSGATKVAYGTTGTGTFTVAVGSTYTVYAVASDGSSLASTSVSPTAVTTHTITATAGSNGSISPSGSQSVTDGGSKAFTITADSGYVISDVLVDGSSVGATSSVTFGNVTADHTISATFAVGTTLCTVTPTVVGGSGGSIIPTSTFSMPVGSSITCYFVPDTGYEVATITVDGSVVPASALNDDGSYTFSNVTTNHTISVSFVLISSVTTHTITATPGSNGSISPSGSQSVTDGGSKTFTITANSGYHIADVLVDGSSAGAVSNYAFSNVTADHTISATFAADTAVTTSLTIHRTVSSVKHGKAIRIYGKLIGGLPSHTKIRLRVQKNSGSYTYVTGYTTSAGSYSFSYKPAKTGTYHFRASYTGTTGFKASASATLDVKSK
jgi:hypothetical protein